MSACFSYHHASPGGEGGIALVELFGVGVQMVLDDLFRPARGKLPGVGRSCLGDLVARGEAFDEAVLTRLPASETWSRLDTWTLAFHGGTWLQERVLELLGERGGKALDTRGVLSLSLAEGRVDAIRASAYELLLASTARRAASFFLRQYDGGELSDAVEAILTDLAANDGDAARARLRPLLEHPEAALRLSAPLRVLLAGRPNAGKSTLFNALVEDERAVVTSSPGTTRDLIEEEVTVHDYPFRLIDSAGLRPPSSMGPVEREGVARVRLAMAEGRCDRVLYLVAPPGQLETVDREFLESLGPGRALVVSSKSDLHSAPSGGGDLSVSARTGEGLPALRAAFLERWLSLAPDQEVPCAPFTESLRRRFELALEFLSAGQADLDGVRRLFIECLRTSWPDS